MSSISLAYVFGGVAARFLIAWIVAYTTFRLIAKQKKVFSKPSNFAKRPRWFFALWVFMTLIIVISSPVISYDAVDKNIIRLIFFLISLPFGIIGFLIYKFIVRNMATKEVIVNDSLAQQFPVDTVPVANHTEPTIKDDSEFFLQATQEVEGGRQKAGLWAKAMALCDGDENKAKYKYINLRAEDLSNVMNKEITPPLIQNSLPEVEPEYATEEDLSVNFLKENGFKVTRKGDKWIFFDALGVGREFSSKGIATLANSKSGFHKFKEKKLA